MKTKLLLLTVCSLNILAWSQIQQSILSTSASVEVMDLTQRGGRYITSFGELKVLVVFAKFKGDESPHQYWPADSYPEEMNGFIDSDMETGSDHYLNLTNFYTQMSYGNFRVTGKAIGAETPYTIDHYISNNGQYPNRALANKDILASIDETVDFSEFDNWTYLSNYNHKNEQDGIVDMIIMIWRGLVFTNSWSGESSLGSGSELLVDDQKMKVLFGYGGYPGYGIYGSGVTAHYRSEKSRETNFKVIIHEIAHWLIGAEHPFSINNTNFWGMLTLADEGICANAFEREKLAWINPTVIDGTVLCAPMSDYITTPCAYKFHPVNGAAGEMFYFENHQKLSIYDQATTNRDDKGIFILHLANGYYSGDCVRILTSDGFWNWEVPFRTDCWGNDLPVFQKRSLNRNGFGNRDRILTPDSCCGLLYSYVNESGEVECNDWLHGYGFRNAFSADFNDVFSPWSNPPARTFDGRETDFLMEVMNQSGSVISVRFAVQGAAGGKPSKPILGISPEYSDSTNYSGFINLVWGADYWDGLPIEPDINWSELQIKSYCGDWKTIYSGLQRYWNNTDYAFDNYYDAPVFFRVRVRDNQNKWSMWSNVLSLDVTLGNLSSIDSSLNEENNISLSEYHLAQNFPNPFNPATKISWQSPVSGHQTLKVFDILGNEVATLVDEFREAGRYEVEFQATVHSSLTSGIYLYRLEAGSYAETKKMILLR